MLKRISILQFIITIGCLTSFAQERDFEGIITYRTYYQSKDSSITAQLLYDIYGDTSKVLIKGSHYKYLYLDSKYMDEAIFDPVNNLMYLFFPNNDTIFYSSCGEDKFEYTFQYSDDTLEVIGYDCKAAKINSQYIKQTFYYTDELRLRNADFHNHIKGGYNLLWSNTQSIYLKVIIEYSNAIETRIAIDIQTKRIKKKEFKIPSNPLKKL